MTEQATDTRGRPIRDLRVSVTDHCNLRCTYCMPSEVFGPDYAFLPREQILDFEEIARIARVSAGLGVTKLRITGGEPLLRRDLDTLVTQLAAIDGIDDIALTTNALVLPIWAERLKAAGLHRLTISLDALDPEIFGKMNGRGVDPARVLAGIDAAQAAGFTNIKVNAVVQRGVNESEIIALAEHFRATGVIVRFIEFMDVGTTNGWRLDDVVPASEIVAKIAERWDVEPVGANYAGETANRYRYSDGAGEFGVIASVTKPFCGGCTRARLSASGELFTCLFASQGTDLKMPLRAGASDADLAQMLRDVWRVRDDRYSEIRSDATDYPKAEMSYLGG